MTFVYMIHDSLSKSIQSDSSFSKNSEVLLISMQEETEVRDWRLMFFADFVCFVRCLQELNWREQGLTSQQVEAKIAALSQSECEQVKR